MLSHICLGSQDLDKTRDFYQGKLGYPIVHEFKNRENEVYGYIFGIGNGTFLEFFKINEPPSAGSFRHFCIAVEDIYAMARRFTTRGIACEVNRGRTDGTLQTWITDPDGIKIEFHQYDSLSSLFYFIKS
jgi:catechol 2,3-dioxygenase-like lactoylglutathione lyase family enzyme